MKHKLHHTKRGTNFLYAVFSVIPTGWTPTTVHFMRSWDLEGQVIQIPTCRVGKFNSNKNSLYKHDTLGGSTSSSLKKTQPPQHCKSHWIHFTRRFVLLPPNKPLQPYTCVSVCVWVSDLWVRLLPFFLRALSPIVKKKNAIRQRGRFISGVKKARLSINQSCTSFNTSLKPQLVEK